MTSKAVEYGFVSWRVEEIAQLLYEASENRQVCRITLRGEPLSRLIHPYGICRTSGNRVVLVCWQALGFTKAGGKEGYRNLVLDDIEEVEMLEDTFVVDSGFNPGDSQFFDWVYHV